MIEVAAVASVAAQSFKLLKAGFAVGRDLESMAGDLSRWMGALSDLTQAEKEIQNPSIFTKLFRGKSIEQEAIEVFAANRAVKSQRDELKQFVQYSLGQSAWNELLALEGSIRKTRAETIYKQREKRRKFVEIVAWILMGLVGCGILIGFVMLLKAHTANAQPDYVQCRLVGCEKIEGMRYCVYRGAWNTQEVISFRLDEWFPREFLCDLEPDKPRPPSMRDTMKAIRDSQK